MKCKSDTKLECASGQRTYNSSAYSMRLLIAMSYTPNGVYFCSELKELSDCHGRHASQIVSGGPGMMVRSIGQISHPSLANFRCILKDSEWRSHLGLGYINFRKKFHRVFGTLEPSLPCSVSPCSGKDLMCNFCHHDSSIDLTEMVS